MSVNITVQSQFCGGKSEGVADNNLDIIASLTFGPICFPRVLSSASVYLLREKPILAISTKSATCLSTSLVIVCGDKSWSNPKTPITLSPILIGAAIKVLDFHIWIKTRLTGCSGLAVSLTTRISPVLKHWVITLSEESFSQPSGRICFPPNTVAPIPFKVLRAVFEPALAIVIWGAKVMARAISSLAIWVWPSCEIGTLKTARPSLLKKAWISSVFSGSREAQGFGEPGFSWAIKASCSSS